MTAGQAVTHRPGLLFASCSVLKNLPGGVGEYAWDIALQFLSASCSMYEFSSFCVCVPVFLHMTMSRERRWLMCYLTIVWLITLRVDVTIRTPAEYVTSTQTDTWRHTHRAPHTHAVQTPSTPYCTASLRARYHTYTHGRFLFGSIKHKYASVFWCNVISNVWEIDMKKK